MHVHKVDEGIYSFQLENNKKVINQEMYTRRDI